MSPVNPLLTMKIEKPTKRKNLVRWQENRLRRLRSKLDSLAFYRTLSYGARMVDCSQESEERCRARLAAAEAASCRAVEKYLLSRRR